MAPHRHPHRHAPEEVAVVVDGILARLRAAGGRATSERRAVVTALYTGDDHHVTADDLARRLQGTEPEIHLATVYRTLEALEAVGAVERLQVAGERAVYHLTDHVHHHLVCESCGSVVELPPAELAGLADELRERHGFVLADRPVTLLGRCAACRA